MPRVLRSDEIEVGESLTDTDHNSHSHLLDGVEHTCDILGSELVDIAAGMLRGRAVDHAVGIALQHCRAASMPFVCVLPLPHHERHFE